VLKATTNAYIDGRKWIVTWKQAGTFIYLPLVEWSKSPPEEGVTAHVDNECEDICNLFLVTDDDNCAYFLQHDGQEDTYADHVQREPKLRASCALVM